MPAYNREDFIGRALDSVLGQVHPADEIIVVDDGSTDRTVEIARAYGSRVRVIEAAHGGAGVARNLGVAAARSDFIAFLDSDDFWEPEHLARLSDAITATDGRANIYFSDCRIEDGHGGGTFWSHGNFSTNGSWEFREHDKEWLFVPVQPIVITAAAFQRSAYLAAGGSDPALSRRGDTHLIFKIGLNGPLCAVPGVASTWTAEASNSLTWQLMPEHPTYLHSTVYLYADLLQRFVLTREQQKILRLRLAAAHYGLVRRADDGRTVPRIVHLGKAVRLDPGGLGRRVARVLRKRVLDRTS